MKKVILFGGSFDPIHWGHYHMANQALKQRGAFELWFIPTQVSPFKESSSNFEHRAKMIEMMISGNDKMKLCTIEKDLPKPSYSYHTVLALQKKHPEYVFEWLIGDDHVAHLDKWYEFEKMNQAIQFIIYSRSKIKHEYPSILGEEIPVSSTAIRQGLQFQTKPQILEYMMHQGLYLDEMLKHRLTPKRYEHTLRVCQLALEIARVHQMDEKQVTLAAMMHDYCKEDYSDISFKHPKVPEALLHGFAASSYLSKYYYIKDRAVLRSIQGHVSGSSHHPLGMLLYIADKCERGRGYDSEPYIKLAKTDLRAAFKAVKTLSDNYRKEA